LERRLIRVGSKIFGVKERDKSFESILEFLCKMAKSAAPVNAFMLEIAPPSIITVQRRSASQKRLDTIVEESSVGLLDADVTSSFNTMGLNHWGSSQRHGSSCMIFAQ
jgi:hypothetical protein